MPLDTQHVYSLECRSWIYRPQRVRNVIGLPEEEQNKRTRGRSVIIPFWVNLAPRGAHNNTRVLFTSVKMLQSAVSAFPAASPLFLYREIEKTKFLESVWSVWHSFSYDLPVGLKWNSAVWLAVSSSRYQPEHCVPSYLHHNVMLRHMAPVNIP
jgi:hypothetical protein